MKKSLIPSCATPDIMLSCYEMITACYVFMAETIDSFLKPMTGPRYAFGSAVYLRRERRKAVKEALESQELALTMVKEILCPTSPIRLYTALKTSELYEKYLKRKDLYDLSETHSERAYQVVKEAISDADSKLKSSSDSKPKIESKSTDKYMALLRERLTHLNSEKEKQQSTGIPPEVETMADINLSDDEEKSYVVVRHF